MFAAEVVQQIASVASCGNDVSSTTCTEDCWLIDVGFFLNQKTSKRQTRIFYSVQALLCRVQRVLELLFRFYLHRSTRHDAMSSRSPSGGVWMSSELWKFWTYLLYPTRSSEDIRTQHRQSVVQWCPEARRIQTWTLVWMYVSVVYEKLISWEK